MRKICHTYRFALLSLLGVDYETGRRSTPWNAMCWLDPVTAWQVAWIVWMDS